MYTRRMEKTPKQIRAEQVYEYLRYKNRYKNLLNLLLEKKLFSLELKNRKKESKKNARAGRMLELLFQGLTLAQVGSKFDITRERVRQIVFNTFGYVQPKAMGLSRKTFIHMKEPRFAKCARPLCKERVPVSKHKKTPFCSKTCISYSAHGVNNREEWEKWRKEDMKKQARYWYWNILKKNPRHKEIISERNKRYAKKRKERESKKN